MKEVIRPHADVEEATRRYAWRIMIRIVRAGGWNPDTSSAVIRCACADSLIDGGLVRPAIKSDGRLLGRSKREDIVDSGYGARHFATIEAPCEGNPGAVVLVLITEIRCLLESLVVIDTENAGVNGGVEDEAAGLRSEK